MRRRNKRIQKRQPRNQGQAKWHLSSDGASFHAGERLRWRPLLKRSETTGKSQHKILRFGWRLLISACHHAKLWRWWRYDHRWQRRHRPATPLHRRSSRWRCRWYVVVVNVGRHTRHNGRRWRWWRSTWWWRWKNWGRRFNRCGGGGGRTDGGQISTGLRRDDASTMSSISFDTGT